MIAVKTTVSTVDLLSKAGSPKPRFNSEGCGIGARDRRFAKTDLILIKAIELALKNPRAHSAAAHATRTLRSTVTADPSAPNAVALPNWLLDSRQALSAWLNAHKEQAATAGGIAALVAVLAAFR